MKKKTHKTKYPYITRSGDWKLAVFTGCFLLALGLAMILVPCLLGR